jgi:hypothetical protein
MVGDKSNYELTKLWQLQVAKTGFKDERLKQQRGKF